MNLPGRVRRLEAGQDLSASPACAIYARDGAGWRATAEIHATGERLPLAAYAARWPRHPTLKAYLADEGEDGCAWLEAL